MSLALLAAALLGAIEAAGPKVSYLHAIRADLALAQRVEIKPSAENGGGQQSVTDAATLRRLARAIPRSAEVRAADGKLSTVSYVVLEIYNAGEKQPSHRITVTPKLCLFKADAQLYEFATEDDALYAALLEASRAAP